MNALVCPGGIISMLDVVLLQEVNVRVWSITLSVNGSAAGII